MNRLRRLVATFLIAGVMLAAAPVHAQETAPVGDSQLPIINHNANQPVLDQLYDKELQIEAGTKSDMEAVTEGEAHGKSSGLPQFDATTFSKQLFWLFVTFAVLYLSFTFKILPAIGGVVEGRAGIIEDDVNAASSLKGEVDALKNGYEKAMGDARAQATALLGKLQNEAKAKAEAEAAAFRTRSAEQIAAVEASAQTLKTRILSDLAGISAEAAVKMAEKVSNLKIDSQKAEAEAARLLGQSKAA